ncbi:hypothetical protein ES707_07547 [subsurface metagenome]
MMDISKIFCVPEEEWRDIICSIGTALQESRTDTAAMDRIVGEHIGYRPEHVLATGFMLGRLTASRKDPQIFNWPEEEK